MFYDVTTSHPPSLSDLSPNRQEEEFIFSWGTPENLCLPFQRSHFCPSGLVYHMVAFDVSLRLWGEHLFGENGSTYEVYV